ncbi:MAG: zinc ribbon domain-containing protein [Clostridia bacterium]|nr:zinc ribbon domain-containing protein [Clostridia bacterium]
MENKFEQLNNTPDTTAEFSSEDIQQNKVMAILAYFGLLVLVPIFGAKDSKFARYHANQGLVLFLAAIAYSIATSILTSILIAISWRLAFLSTIFSLVSIAFLVLMVLGIINAANGKAKELPIIGKFKLLK